MSGSAAWTVLAALLLWAAPAWAGARAAAGNARAVALSAQARAAYDSGEFARAAQLYRQALQTDPTEPQYLYGIGRSEQMGGRCPDALVAFAELRKRLPPDHPLMARAAAAIASCRPAPAPAVVAPPEPATPVAAPVALPSPASEVAAIVEAPPIVAVSPVLAAPQTPPWSLWLALGLAAGAGSTAAWAGWQTLQLDAERGTLAGPAAAARQTTLNYASTIAAVMGAAASAALSHALWVWSRPAPPEATR